ncbi:hypothetical protein HGM15179_008123 [Zosterops borbonicus]|uniref:Uncharacterized protein n=1 Tax=Zosterops borbonicus TaxID=364589 RepID=A0A8K1LME6_9PASS|nr:hypothetical protein HGM15179_008123 [Zosterops borbonicus]
MAAPARPASRNQVVNHLLKDQEEDPKEAKTRVPLKQLRRKQKPLLKSDLEAGPENGLNELHGFLLACS